MSRKRLTPPASTVEGAFTRLLERQRDDALADIPPDTARTHCRGCDARTPVDPDGLCAGCETTAPPAPSPTRFTPRRELQMTDLDQARAEAAEQERDVLAAELERVRDILAAVIPNAIADDTAADLAQQVRAGRIIPTATAEEGAEK